jgi:hypothetical protein
MARAGPASRAPPRAVHELADRVGSEGQPTHEDGEHHGDREVRTAEHQGEGADPHDLVDERGGSGEKEQQVDHAARQEDRHVATPVGLSA